MECLCPGESVKLSELSELPEVGLSGADCTRIFNMTQSGSCITGVFTFLFLITGQKFI